MVKTISKSGATIISADPKLKLEQHPLALKLVPGTMSDEEFEAFCEDVGKRGQQHDIIRYEGKILDGMHRYRACIRKGITPKFRDYDGDDAAGLAIALNVLRRKLGSTQRALAGARLNMDFNVTQDEASKRVGVSKVHINLVVQALRSNNTRLIKLLENPDLTRAALHEEMVDCGVVSTAGPAATSALSAAGARSGLDAALFNLAAGTGASDVGSEFDLGDDIDPDLDDDLLGAPPSAGGKVLDAGKKSKGADSMGLPNVGTRPSHPERRAKDTPAQRLADAFKGLPEGDRISFMQIAWPLMRPLLRAAGLGVEAVPDAASIATGAISKAAATSAAAPATATSKPATAASKPAKPTKGKAATAASKGAKPAATAASKPAKGKAATAANKGATA